MKLEHITSGYWFESVSGQDKLCASILRPDKSRKHWAIAFASCSGKFANLQGKYIVAATLADCKTILGSKNV